MKFFNVYHVSIISFLVIITRTSGFIHSTFRQRHRSLTHLRTTPENEQCHTPDESTPTSEDNPKSIVRRMILQSIFFSTAAPIKAFSETDAATCVLEASAPPEKIEVIKPPLDTRQYEAFVLENGLRVLLCSDPSSNTAAAAMDVHVGATADPIQIPGMAHFNEHMLFLGTKEYPKEDSFSFFLSANGGSSNAFTDSEDTVYYFDMDGEKNLAEGLTRFGSFFESPLFTESATSRELNAIDSENAKNLQNDIFRIYQMEKSRVNPSHPYSKFFTGNKSTLLEGTKRQNIDLRSELIQFYNRYYSANQMTLAVAAPQSLPVLKNMVEKSFGEIPDRGVGKPEEAWAGVPPFADGNSIIPSIGYSVEAVPVQDLRQVTLTWPIVYTSEENREDIRLLKPDFYAGHLLGHEGIGSLLSYLKRQGWANALGASTNTELSDFETFEVTVELTNKGLAAVDDVCEAVFSYIQMMRNQIIPNYVFDEVLNLSELEWRFLRKGEQSNYVQSLATAMQTYDPSMYISGPRRLALLDSSSKLITSGKPRTNFESFQQRQATRKSTSDFLSNLSVDNVFVTVLSKSFEGTTTKKEKWYGTPYRAKEIPCPTLEKWRKCRWARELGMAFPRPNVFIPSEAGLRLKKTLRQKEPTALTFEERMTPIPPPALIRDDEDGRWTVYFKQDDRFGEPKAFVVLRLLSPDVYSTPLDAALGQMYQTCAGDRLEEYAYDARLAGLSYDVQVLPRGVRMTFGGYNDKLGEFAVYVAKRLARDVKEVLPDGEEEFERYKDNLLRALSSFDVKQPYAHAVYYSSLILQPRNFQYTNAELREAVASITLDQLTSYVKNLWSRGKGVALVQGNLDQREALDFIDRIDSVLQFQTISKEDIPPKLKALPLPLVQGNAPPTVICTSEPNPSNANSATQVTFQCLGTTEKDHVLIQLLATILKEPFYEDLRTEQQLGYIVSSGIKAVEETRMLSLIIQSSIAPPDKLTAAVLKFLDTFRRSTLETLTEDEFSSFVKGLIDRKTEPDKRLSVEVTRNWAEIATDRLQFDRVQKEAAALLDLDREDLLRFWDENFAKKAPGGRRILVSEVVPREGPASSPPPERRVGYPVTKRGGGIRLGVEDVQKYREISEAVLSAMSD